MWSLNGGTNQAGGFWQRQKGVRMALLKCPVCHCKATTASYKLLLDIFDVFPCLACGSHLRISRKPVALYVGTGLLALLSLLLIRLSPWKVVDLVIIALLISLTAWLRLYCITLVAVPPKKRKRDSNQT